MAVLLVITVVSEAVYLLGAYFLQDAGNQPESWFPSNHWFFLSRNLAVGTLITGLALRYFYVSHQWQRNVRRQAEARNIALQARIRPHFLFNSMNTIAALTRTNPEAAEASVLDLADLFRASLNDSREMVELAQEIDITRRYERMEKQRLGDRLTVRWQLQDLPMHARIPSLTLQPLVENAIYHGVEPLPDAGTVEIEGRRKGRHDLYLCQKSATHRQVQVRARKSYRHGQYQRAVGPCVRAARSTLARCRPNSLSGQYRFSIQVANRKMSESPTILIVDDEKPARDRLRQLAEDLGGWRIVGEASHGAEALELCQSLAPDVLLLDIRMPGMDGLETAMHLGELDESPAVIFTTAYDDYAIQAFEAQAVGYLLKPVRSEHLQKALQQAARLTGKQLDLLGGEAGQRATRTNICVRKSAGLELIPVDQIIFFQADQKYVTIRHLGGEDLIDESLRSLASEFGDSFIRIHRSVLVSADFLEKMTRNESGPV